MDYEILIGGRRLGLLDSVTVRRSVETLCDTATIVAPATYLNHTLNIEKYLKEGENVIISLGYNGNLETEFTGYLKTVSTDDTSITIECEDELYLWDKEVADKEYKTIELSALLTDIAKQIDTGYEVKSDFEFTYDKFTTFHATGRDVLKKVQDETKANIWFDGKTLHIQPQYADMTGRTVAFDFARNIESSSLKYRNADDRNIEVEVVMNLPNGENKTQKIGKPGGRSIKEVVHGVSVDSLKPTAKNIYDMLCYNGYEGSFTGWLVPYVRPTDAVSLHDADYDYKDGTYYVVGTEVSFSKEGGKRTVKLGRAIRK